MTLLVRNAGNILRENLEFHRRQGVDFFIITDNLSDDTTASIAHDYVRRGIAAYIFEPWDDYSQARWVTRMAQSAALDHDADWVINSDDDEFWYGLNGDLKQAIGTLPGTHAVYEVERRNHVPLDDGNAADFIETMVYRDLRSLNALGDPLPSKIIHRARPDIVIGHGNHGATRAGHPVFAATCSSMAIAHFPIRDFPSFERKIALGGAAYARNTYLPDDVGATWRWLYGRWREGKLRDWYDSQCLSPGDVASRIVDGSLVKDTTVRRVLRSSQSRQS